MKKLLASILWIVSILGIFTVNAEQYPNEMVEAYNRAYENWIITESTIESANVYDALTNWEMETILLNFATYLWLDSDSVTESFGDLFADEDSYANRGNFGTALSKILRWDKYEWWSPYYNKHLEALKAAGIMNQIDNPENKKEIKWYVLIILKNTVTNNWKCEWMEEAKVSHTIDNDTVTLKWDTIEWDNVEISIYDQEDETYRKLWTVNMNDKKFTYKIKWQWEQLFALTNGCDEYHYKVNVNLKDEDNINCDDEVVKSACLNSDLENLYKECPEICQPDAILTNNLKKKVEFKSNETSTYTVFEGTIKALKDNVLINEYSIDTMSMYEEGRDNSYFEERCEKNKTNITFYINIDWKLIWSRYYKNACKLGQWAWFGAIFDKIELNKWQSKKVKVEVKIEGYVQEDETYNFTLYFKDENKNIPQYWPRSISADLAPIKILYNNKVESTTNDTTDYILSTSTLVYIKKQNNKSNQTEFTLWINKTEDSSKVYNVWLFTSSDCSGSPVNIEAKKSMWEWWIEYTSWQVLKANNEESEKLINSIDYQIENWTYVCISKNEYPDYFIVNWEQRKVYPYSTPTSQIEEIWNKNILQNWYSNEMDDAYQFAHKNWITTINTIEKAKMNSPLTRIAMAKMLSYYAINILWQKPDTSKNIQFNNVTDKQNSDYNNAVTLSYQLWIMWQNVKNNNFRPNDEVSRAEFATALSRMLYNTEDGKWNNKYYEPHISKLYDEGIINKTNPNIKETRWYVMIMLMRSAEQ